MRVSLNIVKQFTSVDLPVEELVQRINQQLGGVEEVIDLGAKYKDARIVRVVEAEQHPNADRLRVCKIDDGGVTQDVPRDENGLVQVVCGAPNAHAGMYAVWLPPNSTVPASYDDAEPFVLSARELRGVLSQGMLAASDELAIGTDHDGIIEISEKDLPPRHPELANSSTKDKKNYTPSEAKLYSGSSNNKWIPDQVRNDAALVPGAMFAEVFGLDDHAIDIENKMFTHRPDLFGQLGVAREIAGILGQQFTSPKWYLDAPVFEDGEGLELEVFNDVPESAPRFMAVALKDVEVKPSPLWLQCALVAMGGKPINNIVDVTNYIMLLTAQPTHAYDYDKLRGHKLGVRMARDGEKAELLNGKAYELTGGDIVIADGEGVVGLAGIMGGGNSEVSESTKNIVLEVANFDMYAVRKSSMRHGVFTDALARFNKGQSPLQNDRIMNLLMMSIKDVAGGEQASGVFDHRATIPVTQRDQRVTLRTGASKDYTAPSIFEWGSVSGVIVLENTFVNDRLGLSLSPAEICALLRNVEIKAHEESEPNTPNQFEVIAPFWRTDIELPEDVVEEVGRLYGFDKLPRELPARPMKPTPVNQTRALKQDIRDSLARSGANEVLTYSFVHENLLKKALQNKEDAFKLSNALSPDLQYYRLSVLPSLLDKVHMNIKAGHDEFVLYEIGKGHDKTNPQADDDGLPAEYSLLDMVYASKSPRPGAAYFQMRRVVDQLFRDLGIATTIEPLDDVADSAIAAQFDPARSALLWSETKNSPFGIVGELKQEVVHAFKLPEYTAAASFEFKFIEMWHEKAQPSYRPLSKYPSLSQDISLRVDDAMAYAKVRDTVLAAATERAGHDIAVSLEPVTIYQPANETTKTITLRLTATSYERTLRDKDVKPLLEHAAGKALETVGATLV